MQVHLHYRGTRGRREKEFEKIFKEIIAQNFPNIGKVYSCKSRKCKRVPYRINPRMKTPRYILIKLTKIKDKGKIMKATNNIQVNPIMAVS